MRFFLSSPCSQMQASHLADMDVLLSFATWAEWLASYVQSFRSILIDSGAFSVMNTGKSVDIGEYRAFAERWVGSSVAIAGLDDIGGDFRKSLAAYEAIPFTFPTFHDSDPPELLPELVAMAAERGTWLGIGLLPPRTGKESWVRATLERIPDGIHVHGWALGAYTHLERLNSVDSTNWFRDSWKVINSCPWLTPSEALGLVVLKYKRRKRCEDIRNETNTSFGWD